MTNQARLVERKKRFYTTKKLVNIRLTFFCLVQLMIKCSKVRLLLISFSLIKEGESMIDTQNRIYSALENILSKSANDKIAIVSRGAAIKFLFMKWCSLDKNCNITFKGKIIAKEKLNSPHVFKLEFNGLKLINITMIN